MNRMRGDHLFGIQKNLSARNAGIPVGIPAEVGPSVEPQLPSHPRRALWSGVKGRQGR